MITWGMVGNSHDASLACFIGDKPWWACMAKDFSKVDNDPHFNWTMIEAANQAYGKPDRIIWYEKPLLKTTRQWWAGQGWLAEENNIKNYLKQWDITAPIEYAWHHHAHAAYGYYTSGMKNASILVMDSIGEWECLTIWRGDGVKLKKVYAQRYPHSVGLFYSAMTQRCGLVANRDEYKIADMANKGNDSLVGLVHKELLHNDLDGSMPGVHFKHNLHKGCNWLLPNMSSKKDLNNLAFATQFLYEKILKSQADWCRKTLPSKNLIITGGCALNKQANQKIENDWKKIYVPKNPGDPGSCIGAVLTKIKKQVDYNEKIWYNK
tara:strand:- start:24 stop:989 length:966 start_codon:yes stop_codon:yes gene_type:complete